MLLEIKLFHCTLIFAIFTDLYLCFRFTSSTRYVLTFLKNCQKLAEVFVQNSGLKLKNRNLEFN